ncbi:MAG: hypothetical protein P8N94_15545 [Gammaproteobacteria bacterium]|nr:hypothetical protein [Gammaproteobacteria bacterium]MDG2339375.1 hypothetical protein [Gammaproteobacteria bacterium]
MQQPRKIFSIAGLLLLMLVSVSGQAQQPRFLSLAPPEGLSIVPIMEGWVANPDGTRSFSFGYLNRNETAVEIPLGDANFLEPAEFSSMQPTNFSPGRHTGVFSVTVPVDKIETEIWWNLKTYDLDALRVPGRANRAGYELDFILPRPEGSLQPLAGFGESRDISPGLLASIRDYPDSVTVESEVMLTVRTADISVRDSSDPRYTETLPIGVTFSKHQGPGTVIFTRHPDTVVVIKSDRGADPLCQGCRVSARQDGPNVVSVPGPEGLAKVYANFSEPGNYVIHAKVSNFDASDSSNTNQCCWTNVFQRITVTP